MSTVDSSKRSRRSFLRAVPAAAASGFALGRPLHRAVAQSPQPSNSPATYEIFRAEAIDAAFKALNPKQGNNNIFKGENLTISLKTEQAHLNTEFEMHRHGEHVVQILAGSTIYELGGTLKNSRDLSPGEWRAAESEGASKVVLNKGDMLVIPPNIPHRHITPDSVVFTLMTIEESGRA